MVGRESKAIWRKRSEVMKAVVGRIASNATSWLKFCETLLGIMSHRAPHSKEVFFHETLSKEQSCSDKLLDGFRYLVLYKDILLSWPISCKCWAFWDLWLKAHAIVNYFIIIMFCNNVLFIYYYAPPLQFLKNQHFRWTVVNSVFMSVQGNPSVGEEAFSRRTSVIFFPFTCTVILQCQVPFYTESYLLLCFLLYFLRVNQESGWLVSAIQWRSSPNINGRSAAAMWPAGEAGILTSAFKKWNRNHFKTPTCSTQIPPIPVSHLT